MSDVQAQISELSPEKRALLEALLKDRGVDLSSSLIVRQNRESNAFPLSFAQQRLWFLDQLEPDTPLYNIPMAVRLTGSLDVKTLSRSFNEVIRRHESLRTTFAKLKGEPKQIIAAEMSIPVSRVDLTQLPAAEREARALQWATEEARRPFDLVDGPLVRAILLRLDIDEHILLFTMHHIVSDGWSMGVLIREVATLYAAFSQGQPSPLQDLPIQYVDFAHWQRRWLQGDLLQDQLAYWTEQLRGAPSALNLPTDRPRPAFQTPRGNHQSFLLSRDLADALKSLAQEEEATLFMALLAAFQALLKRYSGQDDISVGTPIANRNRAQLEDLIGFFVNTLVIRTDLSGEPSFRDLLRRVRHVTLEGYAHQDLPFEMLVEKLQPERDMSHAPLFQVMFILQNMPAQPMELPDLRLTPIEAHSGTATFDITLSVAERPDGLSGAVEYNVDLFDAATIRRMTEHFRILLEGVVAHPDRPIATLSLLTDTEGQQLLTTWNDTGVEYPDRLCVHELFEIQAASTPEAVAVVLPATDASVGEAATLTYGQLNRRANQLAHYLQRLAIGPDTLVGLCVDRSLEMVTGLLGILKAGGAYLPLDPTYPDARLAFMIEDAQVSLLLTQERFTERLSLLSVPCSLVHLDADWRTIAQEPTTSATPTAAPDHLAYVIYTSGSTGRPKGVMVPHRAVVNHNLATAKQFELHPDDRVFQFATINFDAAVEELLPTWWCGGTVVLRPEGYLPSGEQLQAMVAQQGLTVLDLPTAYWHEWVSTLTAGDSTLPAPLRLVIVGGEKALAERYARWCDVAGTDTRWLNTYGPTETTIIATSYEGWGPVEGEVPIGRPIANVRLYVLDDRLQPVPVGVPGELCIGGTGLARGYLERPGLTAEQFVPDSVSGRPGARLYRTGDLVRYAPGGTVEFLGRVDHQIKVRGFRVELGEIDTALAEHPAVREVVTLAREDQLGHKTLVSYVVPDDGGTPASFPSDIRAFLRGRLPDYMVPSTFVALDALPLTPSGKVDRRALPAPDGARPGLEDAYVAPRTPVEELLAGMWTEILGIGRVGVYDDFFDLGGHSLLATQLVSRIYDAFGVDVPLRTFFEAPTVAALSNRLESLRQEAQGLTAPPIEPVPRDEDLPLSFSQQRLWFLDHLEPDSAVYNVPDAVRIHGTLNVEALQRSLKELVQRHEVLRTTFPTKQDGKPALVIVSEGVVALPIVDLGALPEAERQAEAERLARAEARRPFDLAQGPLLRTRLLRLSAEDHVALLTMHHIVSDGWSSGILVREIALLYDAFSRGRPSPLPSLPIQYVDFAHWQREWLQGAVLERQLDYWKEQLTGLPPQLELPTDHPRPSLQSARGSFQTFVLSGDLSDRVQALSQQEGATVFMTLLAAFQILLSRYTGQVDVSVGTPIANRNRSEVEHLIGFFVNSLVMRSDLSGTPSFRDVLQQVREVALDAYAHQDVPFEMLVDALQPQRDTSHMPLFQVMFMLQNAPMKAVELSGITLSSMDVETGTAMFDLTLAMEETRDGLRGAIEYNADLFDAATIDRMKGHFRNLLEHVVADPDQPISTLPLLTPAEQRQILIEWNDNEVPDVPDVCLHQVFEMQAERTPDATAVALPVQHWMGSKERELTYAQLNRRANRLAHRLRKLGVGPETLVGLCMDRSLDMFVGLLGILKAGGAYLPLDPTYPDERLSFMMQDAQISVLLTKERLLARLSTLPDADSLVCLDTDWPSIAGEPDDNPESDVTSRNAAYVIYTSGSTGRPKGVLVSHRSVVNHNVAVAQQFGLRPEDRVLQFATINFDAAVEEIFPTWLRGATLILRADDLLTTGEDLLRLVAEESLTVLDLPTAYWHEWVYELSLLNKPLPGSLRLVIVGGEKASVGQYVAWQRIAGDRVAWLNTYGPTEGTIIAMAYEPPADTVWDVNTEIPIGRPIANAQIRLLDRNLQPVPVGVPGELYIGGAAVARGYLNRPALTAECFIPDPFSREPGRRLYGTGDLARYLPEGTVEFLRRVDHQVKVRGFRVEPGEIETVLVQHSDLRDAVVVAQEGDAGDTRLVAYVVALQGPALTVDVLRDFLKEKLPEYMVPSTFVPMTSLPLTASGKVDRRALPTPDQDRPALASAYIAPRTENEEILASIWAEVLGVESVGVHDNFFELGGDSILTIQVVARAKQAGVHVSPRQLFESPTVAGLAMAAGTGPVIQAEQGIMEGPVPLTPIQRWFFDQQFPEHHHWNQSMMVEVEQDLEPRLIEQTVRHLLAHHDALRLRFERGKQSWRQVNAGLDSAVPFLCVDLSGLPEADRGPAIQAQAATLQASLDLTEGPLMRVAHFDLGSEHLGRLLLIVHHLVMDGVSWRILLEDFQVAYGQLQRGGAVQLPPKTTSFGRWARRLDAYAQSDVVREQLPYWLSLAQASVSPLPVDFHDGDNTEASAQSVVVSLSEDETQALIKEVPAAYRTEINDVLLTALALAITRWLGCSSLLVELEGHGREDIWDDVDISRTLGWFTATYPLSLTLERSQGLGEALMAVKKQLRHVPNRGIGYGLLRYLCEDVGERLQYLPRPDVAFNYLGQFDQPEAKGSSLDVVASSRGPDRSPRAHRAHLLEVDGGIAGGRLRLEWTYSDNLHRRTTIERVAQSFNQALRDLIAHCRTPEAGGVTPSDFGLADLSERKLDKVLKKISQGKGTPRR